MNAETTGALIAEIRQERNMTQAQLAEKVHVSDKTISKWENGKGFPDSSIWESLTEALGITVYELISGMVVKNDNTSGNYLKSRFHVCPICGNIIVSSGAALIQCHGITLPSLQAEAIDQQHNVRIEKVEDRYHIIIDHPMTKQHYIPFIASIGYDGVHLIRLYPEGACEAEIPIAGTKTILFYFNQDGLYRVNVR